MRYGAHWTRVEMSDTSRIAQQMENFKPTDVQNRMRVIFGFDTDKAREFFHFLIHYKYVHFIIVAYDRNFFRIKLTCVIIFQPETLSITNFLQSQNKGTAHCQINYKTDKWGKCVELHTYLYTTQFINEIRSLCQKLHFK